jgi:tripartite ATP-independent transporter DctP family solute receptor
MKKVFAWMLVLTMVLGVVAAASALEIKLGHFGKPDDPLSTAAQAFADKLAELSGGEITVEMFGNSVLGNAPVMIEQVQQGAIAALVSQGTLQAYDSRYYYVTSPYMFKDSAQAFAVVDGPFADWVSDGVMEQSDIHNVGPWDYGFRNLTNSVRPVLTPEDVAGLKIRTPQEVQKLACFEALGAQAEPYSFADLPQALLQGLFDGQENPLATILALQVWDLNQKYVSLTHHTWESVNLAVNDTWWEGLTQEQQGMIEEASAYARDEMRALVAQAEADAVGILESHGVQVDQVDTALFKAKMDPAWAQIAEAAGDTDRSMLNHFLDLVAGVE